MIPSSNDSFMVVSLSPAFVLSTNAFAAFSHVGEGRPRLFSLVVTFWLARKRWTQSKIPGTCGIGESHEDNRAAGCGRIGEIGGSFFILLLAVEVNARLSITKASRLAVQSSGVSHHSS